MWRQTIAENTHYVAIYITYYMKLNFVFKIYILENAGMNMCPNSLTTKMNIDKIKYDR